MAGKSGGKQGTGAVTPKSGGGGARGKMPMPGSGASTPKGSTASASRNPGPGAGAMTPKGGASKPAQKMPFPGAKKPFGRNAGRKS
jgi:hypothetical protein